MKTVSVKNDALFNGHSMVGVLQRVMVCSPKTAGWDRPGCAEHWRELGFHHAPNFAAAEAAHEKMRRELEAAGVDVLEMLPIPHVSQKTRDMGHPAEVMEMKPSPSTSSGQAFSQKWREVGHPNELSLDGVYAHDASLPTDFGLILMRMGKSNRIAEGRLHGAFGEQIGIPVFGQIMAPGTSEAGDMVWLDANTLMIGRGYRTNGEGIRQITALLAPGGVQVISAPLPHGSGPEVCLHLMSLVSLLDEKTALVDLSWLAVETVELLREQGFSFIEIDEAERNTLACNVLALGDERLLALEENRRTNERLRAAGFEVRTFPGAELCINGGGGPTCLTRPLLRS